ncbi:MAG: glycosyltransferase family 4 protein [Chitinophagaceae bacterium]|nr:glycosyltransferase family 4 protein [Oligoflexus sp.]
MRYCFVVPHFDETRNSFSKLLAPLLSVLIAGNNEVCILSGNSAYQGKFAAHHIALGLPRFRLNFMDYIAFVIASSLWLLRSKGRFDIIHNHGVGTTLVQNVLTAHACHRAWISCKFRLGEYWSPFLNPMNPLILLVEGINYRRKLPIVAVSETVAQEIARFYPHTKDRITVIPNGLPPSAEICAVRRLNNDSETFIISFASNTHRKKGLGPIYEAMVMAKAQKRDWRLLVLGHDVDQNLWEEKARVLGLENQVVFRGHVNNILDHLAASDIFCLPSFYEAFGMVYLEATLAGLPVVGTRVGIYPSLVDTQFEDRGLPLALPVPVGTLFEILASLQDDREWRNTLRVYCAAKASRYTEIAMVEATLKFYAAQSW